MGRGGRNGFGDSTEEQLGSDQGRLGLRPVFYKPCQSSVILFHFCDLAPVTFLRVSDLAIYQ